MKRLPPELRAELDRLIRDGRYTIDQIVEHLQSMGAEVKRTAVGDYKRSMEQKLAQYREAQEIAGAWVSQLGESRDSQTGQLLAELLKTIAFRTLADMQGQHAGAEPEDLMLLAKAIKDMASAQKTDLEYRNKLRAAWQAEMAEKAEAAKAKVAVMRERDGLSDETVRAMREILEGMVS